MEWGRYWIVFVLWGICGLSAQEIHKEDRIYIQGGVVLGGTIQSLSDQSIVLETAYAGIVEIDRSQVLRMERKGSPRVPKKEPAVKTVAAKKAAPQKKEKLSVPSWTPNYIRPVLEPWVWSFEGGVNLTGKSGNADRFALGLRADITGERKQDRIDLFSRYEYGENRGRTNDNEIVGGVQYTNFAFRHFGFFVREEVERDRFEGIALRSTTGAGFSYRFFREDPFRLEARAGFSYRWEDYLDNGEDSLPGLDLGFQMDWQVFEVARFRSKWTFLPTLSEDRSFIIEQDSGINFPLANSAHFKLRLGLNSQYNSDPGGTRKNLDNSYYVRLLYSWN